MLLLSQLSSRTNYNPLATMIPPFSLYQCLHSYAHHLNVTQLLLLLVASLQRNPIPESSPTNRRKKKKKKLLSEPLIAQRSDAQSRMRYRTSYGQAAQSRAFKVGSGGIDRAKEHQNPHDLVTEIKHHHNQGESTEIDRCWSPQRPLCDSPPR